MFNIFAHAGHDHNSEAINGLDHCMSVIVIAGVIIALLTAIIIYLVMTRQPKSQSHKNKKQKNNLKHEN